MFMLENKNNKHEVLKEFCKKYVFLMIQMKLAEGLYIVTNFIMSQW